VCIVEALAALGPTAMGKAMTKHKGAIVVSLPRTSTRPGMKVQRRGPLTCNSPVAMTEEAGTATLLHPLGILPDGRTCPHGALIRPNMAAG
jgi:hypothetical protein